MWCEIKGYEGLYEINEKAVVRRREGSGSDGRKITSHVILSSKTNKGTRYIALWKDGKRKTFMLHKLYAEAFHMSENEAIRRVYLGFKGNSDAVNNVCDALSDILGAYVEEEKNGASRNDEKLYISQFLYEMKHDIAGCYVEAQQIITVEKTFEKVNLSKYPDTDGEDKQYV